MEGVTQPPLDLDGMEVDAQPPSACVSKVLDEDNLLTEVIVRVGFPVSLVRAAGVCRRWLSHASDRALLRRFRELHPPRLLGFYLALGGHPAAAARFFPMLPQPPEPAAVICRENFSLDTHERAHSNMRMVGCLNGSVVTISHSVKNAREDVAFAVHNPLRYERGMVILPGLNLRIQEASFYSWTQLFFKEEGDGLSYFYVIVETTRDATKPTVHVYMLQNGDDAWRKHLTLADCDLYPRSWPKAVLVDNKIYMATHNKIVVLDLMASILSTIQLPHGVGFDQIGTTMLSRADDGSGVYLIHIKELQLQIWLHDGDNWLLVDTICLSEICADLLEDEPTADIRINHVGDYNEFVFLEMGHCALYLDIKCRTLRKVYEMTADEFHLGDIYPFMTSWPPSFPAFMDIPARFAFSPFGDRCSVLVEVT